jgi:hypothetical protein
VKPFETKLKTALDGFNEICITVITWHMMLFTQYVSDLNTQYTIGWSMIIIICLNAAVNVLIVLFFAGKAIYLIIIKYYNIIYQKLDDREPKSKKVKRQKKSLEKEDQTVSIINSLN